MNANKLYRGRLIDHVHIVVRDLASSRRFYGAVLEVLGIPITSETSLHFSADEFFVSAPESPASAGLLTGRVHLAFQAKDRSVVDRFHAAGLAAGGKDHGKPGERAYHPDYYAAFLLDPDGNNVEAVFHGPAPRRSCDAVEIEP